VRRELRGLERAFAHAGFPVALTGSVALALLLIERGVDPALAIVPPIAGFYLFIAVAERLVPWHRSWLRNQHDLGTDVGLFLTNTAVSLVITPLALAAVTLAGAWLSARIGLGLWPVDAPLLVQLLLALVLAELWEYSFHRAMHEVPWLWRFHATHHSAPRLYWLNAIRFHPIDLFVAGALKVAPLALLGAGAGVFALVNVVSAVHGSYQHANVPVRIGPLNWIFSMTELHRWHHSPTLREANHNYGGNLILWDVVFGTRYLPADREPPEAIGIESLPRFPSGYWSNLAAPFRWRRLELESGPQPDARPPTPPVSERMSATSASS
jgi:sterol desaturase/sphingolipid hydroxylase (fatty acid hydroxylase superfamily)